MPVTPEPAFLKYCDSTVDVQFDRNAAGGAPDQHGGVNRVFEPVTGLQGLACHLVDDGLGVRFIGGVEVPVQNWRALFPRVLAVDRNYRLVWHDPDRGGKVRYLYVVSDSVMNILYSKASCYEHVRVDAP